MICILSCVTVSSCHLHRYSFHVLCSLACIHSHPRAQPPHPGFATHLVFHAPRLHLLSALASPYVLVASSLFCLAMAVVVLHLRISPLGRRLLTWCVATTAMVLHLHPFCVALFAAEAFAYIHDWIFCYLEAFIWKSGRQHIPSGGASH